MQEEPGIGHQAQLTAIPFLSSVVCAPSDDYVTGCLLTRRGSKMLGMHQMVDCVNWMFGY